MDGQRSTQPDDRRDDEEAASRHTLRDPNRVHVTLENLIDLARLDTDGWSPADGEADDSPSPSPSSSSSSEAVEPLSLPRRHSTPEIPPSAPAPPFPPPPPPPGQAQPGQAQPPFQVPQLAKSSQAPAAPDPFWDSGEVPSAEPGGGEVVRARWARPAQRWLPEALAVGFASGAFVIPSVWLLGTAVVCAVAGSVAFVASGHPLRTLPWRAVCRGVSLLHPRSSTWAPVLLARVVLVSLLVPGAIAAALWLADEGRIGVFAAARSGAWTHGFRVAGALVCVMLLTSVGPGRLQRAEELRRRARPLSDGALVLLVLGSCLVATLTAVALPHPEDPVASGADGLGWVPAPARAPADRVRDDIVTAELDALASCLSKRGSTSWGTSYSSENRADEPDVARLVVGGSDTTAPPNDLLAALMAAHNQLAPWVETIEVLLASDDVVRVDRTELTRHRPLTDPAKLTSAATGLQQLAVGPADVTLALHCSAEPVI